MPDPNPKKRDPNQPTPKDPPKGGFGGKVLKLLVFLVFLLAIGTMAAYSQQIGVWPWAWTQDNWTGYLTFSKEKAQNVQDKIESYDWKNLKTKVTDKTQQLWAEAPLVRDRIEEKLGMKKAAPQDGAQGKTADPATAPQGEVTPEHKLALEAMRDAIGHYRKSPDDPAELGLAKKKFEEAQGHLEKALKETNDDKAKADISQELTDCNKYLEDCRAREKT